MSANTPKNLPGPLVLFDGVCNLCEKSVQFIVRRDKSAYFYFAALQSTTAKQLLATAHFDGAELRSVLFVLDGHIYQKSRAALQIAKRLDGAWPLFYYLFFWVPPFVADRIYDFVGNRRYRWFGKKDVCWIPNDDLRRRFIDDQDRP